MDNSPVDQLAAVGVRRRLPGEHGCVGVAGVALLPVRLHGGGDLLPHPDKVLHGAERQLNVIPLQTHQVIWLQSGQSSREKGLYYGENIRAERFKGKYPCQRAGTSKAPRPALHVAHTAPPTGVTQRMSRQPPRPPPLSRPTPTCQMGPLPMSLLAERTQPHIPWKEQ